MDLFMADRTFYVHIVCKGNLHLDWQLSFFDLVKGTKKYNQS